jgi:hypothetical protein
VVSGTDRSSIEDLRLNWSEKRAGSLLADVEPKVAAQMRRGLLPRDTALVLNHEVCGGR